MTEKEEIMLRIGKHAQTLRLKNGLTQEQVAERIKISTPHYANIERGIKCRSATLLYRMAACFHVSADYLLYDNHVDAKMRHIEDRLTNKPEWFIDVAERMIDLLAEVFSNNENP